MPKEKIVKEDSAVKEDKQILVVAVGRVGYYDDMRRYPEGHPKSKPFWIKESQFSDYKKQITGKTPDGVPIRTGLNGWMKKIANDPGDLVEVPKTKKKKEQSDIFKEIASDVKAVI